MGLITSNIIISGSTTSSLSLVNLPTASSLTSILVYNSASGLISYTSSAAIGGGGTPGGSDTYVQFNSGSEFGGSGNFVYDYENNTLNQGFSNTADGGGSHVFGRYNHAFGGYSSAKGILCQAEGDYSHAEGASNTASGEYSHTEGYENKSLGLASHAEGYGTTASGDYSHTEGYENKALGLASHVEGAANTASGDYSHAAGSSSITIGVASSTQGWGTISSGSYQSTVGTYNIEGNYRSKFIVGIGTSANRKDGFTVDTDTNLSGSIMIPTNEGNPISPKTGSMYFNPTTNQLNIYNGTTWVSTTLT
jgi:hypothetical protein